MILQITCRSLLVFFLSGCFGRVEVKSVAAQMLEMKRNDFKLLSTCFQDSKNLKPGCWPRPPVNYCILIALALKSSQTGSLKVQQIYNFTRSESDESCIVTTGCTITCFGGLRPSSFPFPESTSPSSRPLQKAGRTLSDTTCVSTTAFAKHATSCAEMARGSHVFGTWLWMDIDG